VRREERVLIKNILKGLYKANGWHKLFTRGEEIERLNNIHERRGDRET